MKILVPLQFLSKRCPTQQSKLALDSLSRNRSLRADPSYGITRTNTKFRLMNTERMMELSIVSACLMGQRAQQKAKKALHRPNMESYLKNRCLALSCASSRATLVQRFRNWLRVAIHLLRLITLACPLALSGPLVLLARRWLPVLEEMWWDYASWAARLSSPALMKFLQWASTRRDMFPATFCDRFESFQENAPTHPWDRTRETLEMAFGDKWHELFEIDEEPIGSGCIAQVHRGILRSTGEEVAIKVIHPEVKQMVALDLDMMRFFVSILEMVPRLQYLSGRDSVEEFANIMTRQLNLKLEAENLVQFSKHFHDRKGLRFPVPNLKYTTDNILVETLENGEHFKEIFSQLDKKNRKEVAHRILDSYLRMVFLDNFAHGDMHPGNLLFDIGTKTRNQNPHAGVDVVVVDAGIVTKLDPEDLRNFVELFHAVATNQGYKAGELIVMRNRANNHEAEMLDENKEPFCRGVEKIVSEALKWNLKLNQVHVGSLLREVMELCCRHEVKLEGKYASIVVAIGVLEAVGRKLDPDIDILSVALPIILKSQLKSIGK